MRMKTITGHTRTLLIVAMTLVVAYLIALLLLHTAFVSSNSGVSERVTVGPR